MFDVLANFPLVETEIVARQADTGKTTDDVVRDIFNEYEAQGPFQFCKKIGALVNNSAEEFAIQWMTFVNSNVEYGYY